RSDPRRPFPVTPVENMDDIARTKPHDVGEVMRLIRQRDALPRAKRGVYKESHN
ncbi:MAG: hypothetical protein ACI86S_002410, partial [Paracoccaceae bacterium]